MLSDEILFVDDELNILDSYRRKFRKMYAVTIANSGAEAIELIKNNIDKYKVIVTDYKMPNMDGIELLTNIKNLNTDIVRVIITGQADLDITIKAINNGNIFRFLTKPCESETLIAVIDASIKQYNLITAEKELLEQTLKGSVNMLLDILSLVRTDVFSKSSRIKQYIIHVCQILQIKRSWDLELAAMFYFIGTITLPDDIIIKITVGRALSEQEQELCKESQELRNNLLKNIPRLEPITKLIEYIDWDFKSFSDLPNNITDYNKTILGAQILKIALAFDDLIIAGEVKQKELITTLEQTKGLYNPKILACFKKHCNSK